jgi:DNA-binding SARP family transcriptional activator
MPQFRVLGPLEAAGADERPIGLAAGRRQRSLLAALLLHANEVVSTAQLVEQLWGDEPPKTAVTSLQGAVSSLRKLLGPDVLLTRPPGYVLTVDPESLDAARFERLVAEARTLEPQARARQLREALALWRGRAYVDFEFESFAIPEQRRLEELRVDALEDCLKAELDCGRAAEVVPELEALAASNPLRERPCALRMLALYRSGRQADALAVYQQARRVLLAELGIEPGPELQQLHAAILRQEAGLHPASAETSPEEHCAQVADALLAGRLVPVLGADAAALTGELAHRFSYPPEEPPELARVAEFVSLTKGSGRLHDELHDLLVASAAPTDVHRFLAALPVLLRERGVAHQLIVTTSYDLALEQALLDAGEEFDVVSYVASGPDRGRFCHISPEGEARIVDVPNTYATELSLARRTIVLKLHGGLDPEPARSRESFVVTEDDYIDYLRHSDVGRALPVALATTLRRSHLLFLGYGVREWSLRLVLGRLWGSESLSYRSWAVVPEAKPLERELWRARDVELIETPLDEYVRALAQHTGLGVGAPR